MNVAASYFQTVGFQPAGSADGATIASRYLTARWPASIADRMRTWASALFSMSRKPLSVPCPLSTSLMVVRRQAYAWLAQKRDRRPFAHAAAVPARRRGGPPK